MRAGVACMTGGGKLSSKAAGSVSDITGLLATADRVNYVATDQIKGK